MDIPRSDCLLKLWIPRVCHLCQHSLLSPPSSHLSQVSDIIRKVDGNKFFRRPTSLARDWVGVTISHAQLLVIIAKFKNWWTVIVDLLELNIHTTVPYNQHKSTPQAQYTFFPCVLVPADTDPGETGLSFAHKHLIGSFLILRPGSVCAEGQVWTPPTSQSGKSSNFPTTMFIVHVCILELSDPAKPFNRG